MISRRRFMSAAVLGMAAAQGWSRDGLIRGALASSEANPIADDRVSETVLSIHSRTTLIEPPPGAKAVRLWIPVPRTGPGRRSMASPFCAHPHRIETEPVYGNQMVHVESRDQRKGFDVDVRYEASLRRLGRTPGPGERGGSRASPQARRTGRNEPRDRVVREEGRGACERDPVRAARLLYDALIDLLTYDKAIPGCGMGNSAWTFDNKRGGATISTPCIGRFSSAGESRRAGSRGLPCRILRK